MSIAIRVDASLDIGSGHVMRCLTLAEELRRRGRTPVFVCREHAGNLCDVIERRGFSVAHLPSPTRVPADECTAHACWLGASWQQDAEDTGLALQQDRPRLMIVDHYALESRWERRIGEMGMHIAVIDDLADRSHDCRWLVDQNCLPAQQARYASLLPRDCVTLFGPSFALIRSEFRTAKSVRNLRDGRIAQVLIFFGSVDSGDYTTRAILAIRELESSQLRVDVVTGMANPRRQSIEALCRQDSRFSYHCQVTNMAELMAAADLAISAGGFTSYELAYMGVPSILFPLSPIQERVSAELAARGAALRLGQTDVFPEAELRESLRILLDSAARCRQMTCAANEIFDGAGAQRVADVLMREGEL